MLMFRPTRAADEAAPGPSSGTVDRDGQPRSEGRQGSEGRGQSLPGGDGSDDNEGGSDGEGAREQTEERRGGSYRQLREERNDKIEQLRMETKRQGIGRMAATDEVRSATAPVDCLSKPLASARAHCQPRRIRMCSGGFWLKVDHLYAWHSAMQVADANLLKPWQLAREQYKQKKKLVGSREKATLERLAKVMRLNRAAAVLGQATDTPVEKLA